MTLKSHAVHLLPKKKKNNDVLSQKHITCLSLKLQWNPVNPVTNGPQKSGLVNGVAVLKGFYK